MYLTPTDFENVAFEVFENHRQKKRYKNKQRENILDGIREGKIGASYNVCAELWNLLRPTEKISEIAEPKHLLWCLLFLRKYNTEHDNCDLVGGTDPKTFRKWVWIFVKSIHELKKDVIIFENRFRGWEFDTQCLISIDGVDCPIKEQYPFDSEIFSHKLNGPGYKYEVGVSITRGDIVWVNGPFKAGRGDHTIFIYDGLLSQLCDDEHVEVDGGYNGNDKMKGPTVARCRKDRQQKSVVRGRHENVNSRLKNYRVLDDIFRSDPGSDLVNGTEANDEEKHRWCFNAVAVIVQLGFELDEPLYSVEYKVRYDF